jgi:ssDNA-binding replication factor A large subunit
MRVLELLREEDEVPIIVDLINARITAGDEVRFYHKGDGGLVKNVFVDDKGLVVIQFTGSSATISQDMIGQMTLLPRLYGGSHVNKDGARKGWRLDYPVKS